MNIKLMFLNRLLFFFVLTTPVFSLYSQITKINLEDLLVIGADESKSKEYLFAGPTGIVTDKKSNIYIADQNRADIRVFNQKGVYIKTIGRRGQAPGEFQEITSMAINGQELIVVDRMNHRITRINIINGSISSFKMPENSIVSPWSVKPLNNNEYIMYYKRFYRQKGKSEIEFNGNLLHVFNEEFNIVKSFATAGELFNLQDPFSATLPGSGFSLNIETNPNNNKVFTAPFIYNGELYAYDLSDNDDVALNTIDGVEPFNDSYRIVDEEYPHRAHWMANSSGFRAVLLSMSKGLHLLKDSNLAHFTSMERDNMWYYGVELFTDEGKFIDYYSLDTVFPPEEEDITRWLEVLWVDEMNRCYIVDRGISGFPAIRIMQLTY